MPSELPLSPCKYRMRCWLKIVNVLFLFLADNMTAVCKRISMSWHFGCGISYPSKAGHKLRLRQIKKEFIFYTTINFLLLTTGNFFFACVACVFLARFHFTYTKPAQKSIFRMKWLRGWHGMRGIKEHNILLNGIDWSGGLSCIQCCAVAVRNSPLSQARNIVSVDKNGIGNKHSNRKMII